MKFILTLIGFVSFAIISSAQKPKKTFDYKVFAKKAVMSMAYIEKMCPDQEALSFVSEHSGIELSELQGNKASCISSLNEDISFIMDNQIFGVQESIELSNLREAPIKTADIIINYSNSSGKFQYILTNCVQTNVSWYLGDRIKVTGAGVAEIIAKREEKKAKQESGLLGELKEIEQNQNAKKEAAAKHQAYFDSINNLRTGHVAQTFPMEGNDLSSKYYQYDKIGQPLQGYYVTLSGELVSAVIAYQKPEFFIGDLAERSSLYLCKEVNGTRVDLLNANSDPNFDKFVQKSDIQAFYIGDQLFANIPNVGWRIVTSEGAIHTFVNLVKIESKGNITYQTIEQTQKLDGTAFGSVLGGPSKNVFLDLFEDYNEVYKLYSEDRITTLEAVIKYNLWYDESFPNAVKYIPGPQG